MANLEEFKTLNESDLVLIQGGDNAYAFWYRVGSAIRAGWEAHIEYNRQMHALCPLCI